MVRWPAAAWCGSCGFVRGATRRAACALGTALDAQRLKGRGYKQQGPGVHIIWASPDERRGQQVRASSVPSRECSVGCSVVLALNVARHGQGTKYRYRTWYRWQCAVATHVHGVGSRLARSGCMLRYGQGGGQDAGRSWALNPVWVGTLLDTSGTLQASCERSAASTCSTARCGSLWLEDRGL